jgi:predicted O-methyltransferase YrrM
VTDGGSSLPEVQALLRVLAAGRDVAELGTAFGECAAAMAETARSVVTVELDPQRAERARSRLAGLANVEALEGDAYELLPGRGPFGLVFADGGAYDWEAILCLVAPGGLLVKDDLTPGRAIDGDPVREFLLRDARLAAVEVLTTPRTAAIVAVRRS